MQEPLVPDRPLGISEMLTATYRYMRANPSATLGVGAILSVVTAVVNGIVVQGMIFGGDQGSALTRMLTGETLTAADAQAVAREVASVAPLLGLSSIIELLEIGRAHV